jgi:hypothetical protein
LEREGSILKFLAVFRNSMNVITNVKKLWGFFVIDGKEGVGLRAIFKKYKRGVTHLHAMV